jgi:hypothetical protein
MEKVYLVLDITKINPNLQVNVIGSRLGFDTIEVDKVSYEQLLTSTKHVLIDEPTAKKGNRYWGETRDKKSSYTTDDAGVTQKAYVSVSEESLSYAVSLMKIYAKLFIQAEIDNRFTAIKNRFSEFETTTWNLQLEEATKVLADDSYVATLLTTLAESREITVKEFATKVIDKSESYKSEVAELLTKQQTIGRLFQSASTVRELNKLYEDYFGIEMPLPQAIEEGLTDENAKRTSPFEYGIKF